MKRFAILLMCAMLLLTTSALAERVYPLENAETCTSVTGLITYERPADSVPMTEEFVESIMDGDFLKSALGDDENAEQIIDSMVSTVASVDLSQMDFVYTADFEGNFNIIGSKGIGITPDMLSLVQSVFDEQLVATYVSMGVSEDSCSPQGIQTIGSNPNQFYVFYVEVFGASVHQYISYNEAGDQITLSFTNFPQDQEFAIVESVQFN